MPRILGIDYGSRRVGLALSDDEGRIATPLGTVDRRAGEDPKARVAAAVREHGVTLLVLGIPLDARGGEGAAARRVRAFGEALAQATGTAVHFEDERFSTRAAHQALDQAGVRGATRRAVVDESAATLLLQGYLDRAQGRAHGSEDDRHVADTQADLLRDPRRGRGR